MCHTISYPDTVQESFLDLHLAYYNTTIHNDVWIVVIVTPWHRYVTLSYDNTRKKRIINNNRYIAVSQFV